MRDQIDVFPPHGFVRLVKYMGSELDVVNAARVSFHKESKWGTSEAGSVIPGQLSKGDEGLIRFLLKNKHGSPFEQGFQSMWHIRLPIFVMREWVRHRIGHSLNEESGRYVQMRDDFFHPAHLRVQKGKPGAYTFEPIDDPEMYTEYLDDLAEVNKAAWDFYLKWLGRGVAKEQARIVLPLNLYTEIRWTANARSLMNFLALRNAPDAMFEIRCYAQALETLFAPQMPTVHKAFSTTGRIAP